MNRTEKQQAVESLGEQFREMNNLFLIDYRGMKVVEATELRRKIREIDGKYLVVKNTLAGRAAAGTSVEALVPHFSGPTAVAYHQSDIIGLAKVLNDAAKTLPSIQFKAAMVEGKVVPASEIKAIASMPSREALLGQLAFLLMAPLQKLVTVLKAPMRDLSLVLNQIKKSDAP